MRNQHPAVWALALAAFAIGIAEFVVVGILPSIAIDLGVTQDRAGHLVSGYALALAVGTPIVALALSKVSPLKVCLSLISLFAVGNIVTIISSDYSVVMLGRVLTAVAHGSLFALGATVASRLAPEGRSGDALALMFSGLTLAMVVGVPFGSLIGNAMGWKIPFLFILGLAVISFVALWSKIPSDMEALPTGKLLEQIAALKNPAIILAMGMTAAGFGATFPLFTFINAWLTGVTGFTSAMASTLLVVFGVATLVGNLIGGRLVVKQGWRKTSIMLMLGLTASMVAIFYLGSSLILMPVLLGIWGVMAFGCIPAFQSGMMSTAEEHEPQAMAFASSLNISAFNIGISLGAAVGSAQVAAGQLILTPVSGGLLALVAVLLVVAQHYVSRKKLAAVPAE